MLAASITNAADSGAVSLGTITPPAILHTDHAGIIIVEIVRAQ
jgi:hypothetical protein